MDRLETATILLAPVVIDRKLEIITNGFVAIRGDRTLGTGTQDHLSIPKGAKVISLKNRILMPGLVNAHCHLDYTDMKGKVPASGGFAAWVLRIVKKKKSWSDANFKTSIQRGMKQCLDSGTTTIANITCVPHLVSSLKLNDAPRIWWFIEQLDLGQPGSAPLLEWNTYLKKRFEHQSFSLSPHAPYSVTPELFQQAVLFCDRHSLPWTAHVAESREEWQMFHDAAGQLFEVVKRLGRDISDCGKTTPFRRLLDLSRLSRQPGRLTHWKTTSTGHIEMDSRAPAILAHMNCLSDEDLALLRVNRAHFSVAHCPRSHAFFRHPAFRLNELHEIGVTLCLGTDSLASNRDLSLFSEMRKMSKTFPDVPARAIVQMATVNGAAALGEAANWPHWADWIAIHARGGQPWKNIIQFAERPDFVMVAGRVVKKMI
jgi:aminodeoxyfutalosine deaminase